MEGSYSAQLMLCVRGAEYLMFGGALQYVWTVPAISQVSGQISRRMIGTPCTTSRSIPFASIAGAPTMSCTPFAPRVGPFRCNGALLLLLPFGMSSMTIELPVHAAPTASARYPETSTVAEEPRPKSLTCQTN